MRELYFAREFFNAVMRGDKRITILKFDRPRHMFRAGEKVRAVFPGGDEEPDLYLDLEITDGTQIRTAWAVPDDIAREDGFENSIDLVQGLRKFYPGFDSHATVGIIRFRVLENQG